MSSLLLIKKIELRNSYMEGPRDVGRGWEPPALGGYPGSVCSPTQKLSQLCSLGFFSFLGGGKESANGFVDHMISVAMTQFC